MFGATIALTTKGVDILHLGVTVRINFLCELKELEDELLTGIRSQVLHQTDDQPWEFNISTR